MEENKTNEEIKVDEETEEEVSKRKKKKIDSLLEENAKLKADADHWKNEYYRAYADTKNLRANLERDHKEALKYRSEGFIENLLPILDSFHMALANEPTDQALKNYLIGFQFIYRNLVGVLDNEGVKEISPTVGDKFNPSEMSAVDTVEGEQENVITKVYAKGYKLHDRLIRTANVQVSVKAKPQEENKPEQEKVDA